MYDPKILSNIVMLLTNKGRMTYTEIMESDLWWLDLFIQDTVKRLRDEQQKMDEMSRRKS